MNKENLNLAIETLTGTNAIFQIQNSGEIWLSSASHSVIQRLITRGFSVYLQKPEGYEETFLTIAKHS